MADVSRTVSGEATSHISGHPLSTAAPDNMISEAGNSEDVAEATPVIRPSLDRSAHLSSDRPTILPSSPAVGSQNLQASDNRISFERLAEDEQPQNDTQGHQYSEPTQAHSPENYEEIRIRSLFNQRIDQLQKSLPHLNNIKYRSRREEAKVDFYDFSPEATVSVRHAAFRTQFDGFFTDNDVPLHLVLNQGPPSGTNLRLIVIEDLSSKLLRLLGSLLDISVEVFEEHLLNSGWTNGTHVDPTEDSWITANMAKDYVSMKWYRPVRRRLPKPSPCADRAALLDPREPKRAFKWTEVFNAFDEEFEVEHSLLLLSNVFRECWDIQAEVSQSKDTSDIVLCEERATIWSQQRQDYRIVIALLDSLPMVSDTVTGTEKALEMSGFYPPLASEASMTVPTGTSEVVTRGITTERRTALVSKRIRVIQGSRRSPTIFDWVVGDRGRSKRLHIHQLSTDPENPVDAQHGQSEHSAARSSPQGSASMSPEGSVGAVEGSASRSSDGSAEAVSRSGSEPRAVPQTEQNAGIEILTLHPVEQSIFNGLLPRGPPLNYQDLMSSENIAVLRQHLHTESSTSEDLAQWIRCRSDWANNVPAHGTALDCLFAIIQNDTMNTLHLMNQALSQIGRDTLDDTLIQQRVVDWRSLLERFDADLRKIERSLRNSAQFIASLNKVNYHSDQDKNVTSPSLVEDLQQTCVIGIANLRQRTQSSYQSLMASMSIVESKRGIAEAESVTKLTELAFLFIPLTFSASIFSMQVKELSATKISVSAFIILALAVTFLSYGLRLLIRSQAFIRRRREWIKDIRTYNRLAASAQISTTSFLLWLWRRIGLTMIVVILTIALIVAPIVALWTSGISRGLKAVLTILLLVLTGSGSFAAVRSMYHIRAGSLHFRPNLFSSDLD